MLVSSCTKTFFKFLRYSEHGFPEAWKWRFWPFYSYCILYRLASLILWNFEIFWNVYDQGPQLTRKTRKNPENPEKCINRQKTRKKPGFWSKILSKPGKNPDFQNYVKCKWIKNKSTHINFEQITIYKPILKLLFVITLVLFNITWFVFLKN